ncbi:MAG: efflux RND transporter periplasmic adaptor subunit [Desulforegulaceae bacterium]|nr:efflux RND transporter periplasmic adaptor subunit [Desulforegulaceae bacterium]
MKPEKKMSNFLTCAFSVILISAALVITGCSKPEDQQGQPQGYGQIPKVTYVTIKPQSVELTTELPARTSAYLVSEIKPQVNGIIQKRFFEEGADVEEGQILYKIDDAPFKAALKAAKATLDKAKASLPPIKSMEARYKRLLSGKAISQQQYDDVKSELDQVLAQIRYLEAEVDRAEINLGYTDVKAPISGRIGKSLVTVGALVTGYQPTPLTTIHKFDPIYVDAAQSTSDMLRLRENLESKAIQKNEDENKVNIILENGKSHAIEGKFKFRDVIVDPNTGSSLLRIVVPNPSRILLPGMYVRAVLQEGIAENAILAPQEGVARTPKGEPFSYIVSEKGEIELRMLTINRAINNKWLIIDGLSDGDKVVVEGRSKIRAGAIVEGSEFKPQ